MHGENGYLPYFWFHTYSIQQNKMLVNAYANFLALQRHILTTDLVYRSTRTRQAKLFVLLVLKLVLCVSSLPHAYMYVHAYVVAVLVNVMIVLVLVS